MFFKRRWFKILAAVLGVVGFVAYFAFSTFFFPPHERGWKFDLAALIPRDVDFFVGKAGLGRDFDKFPELAVMEKLRAVPAWQTLSDSPEYDAFLRDNGVEESLAELQTQLDQIPLGMDPLTIFGGRNLALAGRFTGGGIERAEWAIYGRANWAGKLAISALSYPGMIGLESQGLTVTETDGVVELSGGSLSRPLYVTRVRDVGVISTNAEFPGQARELAARSGEGSLYLSADYGDHIDSVNRSPRRDEVELIVDLRTFFANLGGNQTWPDTRSERFLPAFLGRIFQAPSCKKVMGVIGFDEGMSIDLYGGFSSELITDEQRRIYSREGFGHDEVLRAIAALAPADTAMFVYLHGPIDVLLKQVFASVEPAMRSNLEDAFRSTGQYNSLDELIDTLASSLDNKLAFIVRTNDYRYDEGGPPNDGQPVFAVALVTWHENEEEIIRLRDLVGHNPEKFGLQGADGATGYYKHTIAGFDTREFWAPLVPGTGVVATMNTNEHCYVTNHYSMLQPLYSTFTQGGRDNYQRLADRPDFKALLDDTIPSANLLVWMDPSKAALTLTAQAERWAQDNAARGIDWNRKRLEEESEAMRNLFPNRNKATLSDEERSQLDAVVNPVLSQYRNQFIRENAPQLLDEKRRQIEYMQAASSFLMLLQLEPRAFRLSVRIVTPLE